MPARYRPNSEYKKRFRWHESVKSASFTPAPEQQAPKAGLASGDIGYVRSEFREPALQRRRKTLPDQVTHTVRQVNYGPSDTESDGKARPHIMASAKTYKIPHHTAADISSDKRKPTVHGNLKPTRKPAGHTNGDARPSGAAPTHRKDRHDSGSKASDSNQNNNKTSRRGKTSPRGSDRAARNGSSADKVQSNIALQYQAGIHPNRPKNAKYLSEYQRQFEWKKPLPKESPLMAAEQMVYSSSTNLAPYVPDKIPRHTEYQKQFKPWQPLAPPPQDLLKENAQREIKAKYMVKTKSKKVKKSGNTPDKMHAAGVPSVMTHENMEQLKASQNPQQPFFPHSTIRKWKSEYRSNYKPPQKFSYEDGVWKGAGPPHVQPKDDSQSDIDRRQAKAAAASSLRRTKSQHDLPNWFSEVLELRKKAQEYQQRARGTHFSKEHVAQLIAKQAQMWDASSTTASSATSSLSALSAEVEREGTRIPAQPAREPAPSRPAADNNNNGSPVRRKLAWPEHDEDRLGHKPSPEQDSSIGRIPTPEGFKGSVSASSDDFEPLESNGRPPTPQLKATGLEQRHHLQRTTPAVGGAILTSPKPIRKSPPARPSGPGRTYAPPKSDPPGPQGASIIPGGTDRGFGMFSSDEDDDDQPTPTANTPTRPMLAQKTRVINKSSPPPAGITTRDPHPLNNKLASPSFQRHSKNFFETHPAMPEMARGISDPPRQHQTWAAPRNGALLTGGMGGGSTGEMTPTSTSETGSDEEDRGGFGGGSEDEMRRMRTMPAVRDEERIEDRPRPATMHGARKGPLDRPNSGNIYGRPMTAYPQTRQAAADHDNPSTNRYPSNEQQRPTTKTWTVPRETNVNALSRGQSGNIPSHRRDDSTVSNQGSDRLSMSGISSVSSATLASEVLERARKRRDDFWGTP